MHFRFISERVGLKFTTLVVIGTDCIASCKSNYHTIKTLAAPCKLSRQIVCKFIFIEICHFGILIFIYFGANWKALVPLVEQELLTLSEQLSSLPIFSGVPVTRSLVLCVFYFRSLFVSLYFFFWPLCSLNYHTIKTMAAPCKLSRQIVCKFIFIEICHFGILIFIYFGANWKALLVLSLI
jgi:hypothetical protein